MNAKPVHNLLLELDTEKYNLNNIPRRYIHSSTWARGLINEEALFVGEMMANEDIIVTVSTASTDAMRLA